MKFFLYLIGLSRIKGAGGLCIYEASRPGRMLDAYIADYLKEEIAAEGLVRNLPTFSDFLDVASLSDGQTVNFSSIARDCGVSNQSIKNYFQILEDTLLARWLPAYKKRPKRRVFSTAKFYFADVGVVNRLARRGELLPGTENYGKALRNIIVDHPGIERRIVVCRESRPRKTSEGIEIMPAEEFAKRLWDGDIF